MNKKGIVCMRAITFKKSLLEKRCLANPKVYSYLVIQISHSDNIVKHILIKN